MSFDFACLAIGVYYAAKTFILLRKYDIDMRNTTEKESKELISDINQAVTPETPDFPADDPCACGASRGRSCYRCVDDTPSNDAARVSALSVWRQYVRECVPDAGAPRRSAQASSDSNSVLVDDINQTDLRSTITPLKLTPYNYLSSAPTGWYKCLESLPDKDPFTSVGDNRCQSKLIFDFSDWETTGKSRCMNLSIDGMGTYKVGEHVDLGKYSILDTTFTHKWIKNVYEYLDTDTKNAMIFIECADEPDINVPPCMRGKYIFYVNVSPDKEAYIEKIPLTDGRFYVYRTNNGYYICDRNNLKSSDEIENYTRLHTY